ncbi:MAG: DUF3060 domain-containing protein [Mycobacterium sp.]|nr:DUF3060 domain-containing protein [Mycobacterium sp.]
MGVVTAVIFVAITATVIWSYTQYFGNDAWACAHASTSGIDCSKYSTTSPSSVPQGGDLTLDDTGKTTTIGCNDGHLTVNGLSMTVTVTGHCVRLIVEGADNHVTVEAVDAIDADGANNIVIFHSGGPHITKTVTNTVQQG